MGKLKDPKYILDGDLICYRAAAATDGREYVVSWYLPEGNRLYRVHKYKKDADVDVREAEALGLQDIKCELQYNPEPVENALKIVKESLESLETALLEHTDGLGERKIYISRGGSFREKEIPSYKQLRVGSRRPEHLEACKDYLLKYHGAECRPGEYEADDLMAMEASKKGACVICSLDKDLLQVPGHHFNWVKGEYKVVTEVEGWRHLFSQLLTGDTADGIPGIHGIGPKKAEKILKDIDDPFMMYVEVLKAYIKDTGRHEGESQEDYHKRIVLLVREHMTLLYLLRRPGERFQVPEKRKDVTPEYNSKYGTKEQYIKYLGLIERVRSISPDAAALLQNPEALSTQRFHYSSRLGGSFVWGSTPKQHHYWSCIYNALGED